MTQSDFASAPTSSCCWSLALSLSLLASTVFAGAREIRGFALTVSNLDSAVAFYQKALGFKKVGERIVADRNYDYLTGVFGTRVRSATLQLGDERIELEQYLAPGGQPIPVDSRSNDLWFQHFAVVVSDMERAYEHLRAFPIQSISSAPQTIPESNKAAAGIKAYKFKDPDGHPLELLWFPPDKGKAKWQSADGRLFLGIDHSAIGISSTERSTGVLPRSDRPHGRRWHHEHRHDPRAARQRFRRGGAHHRAASRPLRESRTRVPAVRDAVRRTALATRACGPTTWS